MIRLLVASLLISGTAVNADEPNKFRLKAPSGWGGETIKLPPGFAPDMKLKGLEHIRFAPGMMQPNSKSFFSYAFAFELQPQPRLTEAVVKDEFLKYYRGLCKAVLNGTRPDVDTSKFTLKIKRLTSQTKLPTALGDKAAHYVGTLEWVEPFATKKPQKLNLEMQTWIRNKRSYIFVCVSPQARDAAIWKQLHTIRDTYLNK